MYPRYARERLLEALEHAPVVLIHGPRQCGKTTLAKSVAQDGGYDYIDFDEKNYRDHANSDPDRFVRLLPDRAILDEVQRVPELFSSLKAEVDRNRVPGRFILTGSANVLLLPKLSDSLAGRMTIIRLHPLAQGELAEQPPTFLDRLFARDFKFRKVPRSEPLLVARVEAGGYPPALALPSGRKRALWHRDYLDAVVQRNLQDLANVRSLELFAQLLQEVAAQTAQLVNVSQLAAPLSLSRPTVQHHLSLLQQMFLLETVPPWYSNRLRTLVKTPKMHVCDTGIVCALLNLQLSELETDRTFFGHLLETFVLQELRRQSDGSGSLDGFFHYRDKAGAEVDIVVRRGHVLVGLEVKAGSRVSAEDFHSLEKFRKLADPCFAMGAVVYDGEHVREFGENLLAIPIRELWEVPEGKEPELDLFRPSPEERG